MISNNFLSQQQKSRGRTSHIKSPLGDLMSTLPLTNITNDPNNPNTCNPNNPNISGKVHVMCWPGVTAVLLLGRVGGQLTFK